MVAQAPAAALAAPIQTVAGVSGGSSISLPQAQAVPMISGQAPLDVPGAQIGSFGVTGVGIELTGSPSAQTQAAPTQPADTFPGAAVGTVDIQALSAYLCTASSGCGTVVDPPAFGQAVYFYLDFQLTGSGGPVVFSGRAVLDGTTFCGGSFGSVPIGGPYAVSCSSPWTATVGSHTLQWDLDYTGIVDEPNEGNNSTSKSFTPPGQDLMAELAYMRTAASGGGSIVDHPTIGQTVFFHLDWQFNGTGGSVSVSQRAVLDGSTFCSFSTSAAPPSSGTSSCPSGWVATAGPHTLQWDLDYTSAVTEVNETNNSASKCFTPGGATGLAITPTFDAALTVGESSVIKSAINFYECTFTDPITVTIKFQHMASGLGQSSTWLYPISYSTFSNALHTDANPSSADDAAALASLPIASTNPVNGSANILVKTATIRALGIGGSFPPTDGFDGTISFNPAIVDVNGGSFSLLATIEHEIDEVLGLGSSLPNFTEPQPEDLFRYASTAGVRSFATNPSATNPCTATPQAFFSIDGAADLYEFNNCNNDGDYGDWKTGVSPQVQDAFATPSAAPFLTTTSTETRALDVVGYNIVAPPSTARRRSQLVSE
jgi:hypothetical protein